MSNKSDCGWQSINEATKDGTRYPVATDDGMFTIGRYLSHGDRDEQGVLPCVKRQYKTEYWGAASRARRDGWYSDQDDCLDPQPAYFYNLPPPIGAQKATEANRPSTEEEIREAANKQIMTLDAWLGAEATKP